MENLFGNSKSSNSGSPKNSKEFPKIIKKFKRNPNHSYVYFSIHFSLSLQINFS